MSNAFLAELLGYALDFPKEHVIFDPRKRHDFLYFFDASKCNPNGDPDNDNMPRQDFESRIGLVSGPCQKRKQRDFMARVYGTERENKDKGMNLYVKHRGLLKSEHKTVADKLRKEGKTKPTTEEAQRAMREYFWDVRMFGAVLTVGKEEVGSAGETEGSGDDSMAETPPPQKDKKTGKVIKEDILNGGQCTGCVSIGMAESVEEISPGLMPIVRDARVDNPTEAADEKQAISAMPGNLPWMPYGLYRGTGHFSPNLDKDRLVKPEDLAILWNSLRRMFENDTSAARPANSMKALGAWVFTHDHKLGNYPIHKLFELIQVNRSEVSSKQVPAQSYRDYNLVLAWKADNASRWRLEAGNRLFVSGKEIGVTVTELYNDWDI